MKSIIGIVVIAALAGIVFWLVNRSTDTIYNNTASDTAGTEAGEAVFTFTPIEHASMVLEWGGQTIYVDPVGEKAKYPTSTPDIILITDIHGDHFSTSTLEALAVPQTRLVVPQAVADLLPSALQEQATVLVNGASTTLEGFVIEAVPMYNLPESPDSRHVKGRGNGYIVERIDTRVYIAGDTADTPEMRALRNINVAFVPMNPPYTMDVETAADAVLAFAPSVVYPYHYRGQDGLSDVEKFKALVEAGGKDIDVVLLDWYPDEEGG